MEATVRVKQGWHRPHRTETAQGENSRRHWWITTRLPGPYLRLPAEARKGAPPSLRTPSACAGEPRTHSRDVIAWPFMHAGSIEINVVHSGQHPDFVAEGNVFDRQLFGPPQRGLGEFGCVGQR